MRILIFTVIAQAFGKDYGHVTPITFLHYAYKYQIRLCNFPVDFPFPKLDIDTQRGWSANHTYRLLNPRLAAIEKEFNEQSGLPNPENSDDEAEDESYYFEEWTEGM